MAKKELEATVITMRLAMADIQSRYGGSLKSEQIQRELTELKESAFFFVYLRFLIRHHSKAQSLAGMNRPRRQVLQ